MMLLLCIVFLIFRLKRCDFDIFLNSDDQSRFYKNTGWLANSDFQCFIKDDVYVFVSGNLGYMEVRNYSHILMENLTSQKQSITNSLCPSFCDGSPYRCGIYETCQSVEFGYLAWVIQLPQNREGTLTELNIISPPNAIMEWTWIGFDFYGKESTLIRGSVNIDEIPVFEFTSDLGFNPSDSFNEYGIVLTNKCIKFYVNNVKIKETCKLSHIPPYPYYNQTTSFFPGAASSNSWLGEFVYTSPVSLKVQKLIYIKDAWNPPNLEEDTNPVGGEDDVMKIVGYILLASGGGILVVAVILVLLILFLIIVITIIKKIADSKEGRSYEMINKNKKRQNKKKKKIHQSLAKKIENAKIEIMLKQQQIQGGKGGVSPKQAIHVRNRSQIHNPKITKIEQGIYLGNHQGAKDFDLLQENGIKTIINVSTSIRNYHAEQLTYFNIDVEDDPDEELYHYFGSIHEVLSETNDGPFFVHSANGNSRAASLVIAYVMQERQWKCQQAFNKVKSLRRDIEPNDGFMNQLLEFEIFLFGNQTDKRQTRFFRNSDLEQLRETKIFDSKQLDELRSRL